MSNDNTLKDDVGYTMAEFLNLTDMANQPDPEGKIVYYDSIEKAGFNDCARIIHARLSAYLQDLDVTGIDDKQTRDELRAQMKWVGN